MGKEVAAQMVHALDPRPGKREFVAVNCAAIPEAMLEAEFFGCEKGAFSGAVRAHKGYLERADGGTLFLDEVGDLPASMQAKLLRALQEKCFCRLGAERTTHSDFRILAATNRDLHADMNAGMPAAFLQARSSTPRGGIQCPAPDASWFDVTRPWSALSLPSSGW